MSKILMTLCMTLTLLAIASAQTASELADKYPHHEVYKVQPGVQMSAKFSSDGLVCEMDIEQTHFSKDKVKDEVDLRDGIREERINGLIDQLVPPSERGQKNLARSWFMGLGQIDEKVESYSNVNIDVSSSHGTTVVEIKWRHRKC